MRRSSSEFLNERSRVFFDTVRRGLDKLGIGQVWNPYLVRGLDYYAHTAFEFKTDRAGRAGRGARRRAL